MSTLHRLVQRRAHSMPVDVDVLSTPGGLLFQNITAVDGPRVRINGQWVLSFASSQYLGLAQDPRVTEALARAADTGVSLGMPRALGIDSLTLRVEKMIAELVGQEQAIVFPSTTHAALDVLPLLTGPSGAVFMDELSYPISVDAATFATRNSERLFRFPHNDHAVLDRLLANHVSIRDKVIVCDGVYPLEGKLAALRAFDALAERYEATIYVDDAHGIGIFGAKPDTAMPLGYGGGGTLARLGIPPGNIVHVGGLSKAFGIPIAFVAGPSTFISHLRVTARSFVHCSPPAPPLLAAALSALWVHSEEGDDLRWALIQLVRRLRNRLQQAGVSVGTTSLFPIQSLHFPSGAAATRAAVALRREGIWPVLQLDQHETPGEGALHFVITARHRPEDVDVAVEAISRICAPLLHSRPVIRYRRPTGDIASLVDSPRAL
jgi:7-keto-8-aminopelargonate synthetase-like enzyme